MEILIMLEQMTVGNSEIKVNAVITKKLDTPDSEIIEYLEKQLQNLGYSKDKNDDFYFRIVSINRQMGMGYISADIVVNKHRLTDAMNGKKPLSKKRIEAELKRLEEPLNFIQEYERFAPEYTDKDFDTFFALYGNQFQKEKARDWVKNADIYYAKQKELESLLNN